MKTNLKRNNLILLLIGLFLFLLNTKYVKAIDFQSPILELFIHSYFNDVLGGICFIAYVNEIFLLSRYRERLVNSYTKAILIMGIVGVFWEYIIPTIYPHGTTDALDLLAYVIGGILYTFLGKSWELYRVSKKKED